MYWRFFNKTAVVVMLNVATGVAFAQFAWVDAKGVRQYSDQPPPASIPKSHILKQPAAELRNARPDDSAQSGAADSDNGQKAPTATKVAAPPTLADKNADFNKRRAEQAEKDKKAADEASNNAAKAKNCERAQTYARTLASGVRVATTDKNGERVFLSDDKRAQEANDTRRMLDSCK